MRVLWIGMAICTVFSAADFVQTILFATSAPQQTAGAAIATACAVIPYVFARALEGFLGRPR